MSPPSPALTVRALADPDTRPADLRRPGRGQAGLAVHGAEHAPHPWVETDDITNAVLYLASAVARFVTGVALPVDAGYMIGRWG